MPAPKPVAWYVMIRGKETGPMTRVDIGVEARTGRISATSEVWHDGMAQWTPAGEVPELASLFVKKKEFVPSSQKAVAAPGKKDKGAGMTDFDTSHFRLADLQKEDDGQSRQLEFDTSHFKLADLKKDDDGQSRALEFDTSHFKLADLAPEDSGKSRDLEFDTSHFRLSDLPKQETPKKRFRIEPPKPSADSPGVARPREAAAAEAPTAPSAPRVKPAASKSIPPPPVATPAPPKKLAKPKPPPQPEPEEDRPEVVDAEPVAAGDTEEPVAAAEPVWDPNSTVVDFNTLGEQLHRKAVSSELFGEDAVEKKNAADLSKWAADEIAKAPAEKAAPPPKPAAAPPVKVEMLPPPPQPSMAPMWAALVVGFLGIAGLLVYLLRD